MRATARDIRRLRALQRRLTGVLVVITLTALVFTATSVTLFAIRHGVHPAIAWLLDPMVVLALATVLITDGVLAEYGIRPRGWASVLRYFAGLATWVMNCWSSVWPPGTEFGRPAHVDAAGLVLHSIPPVLLIALAEAATSYRRAILAKVEELEAESTVITGDGGAPPPSAVPAVPEVYPAYPQPVPERPRPVPEAVPRGVRLLPIVARPEPARDEMRDESRAAEGLRSAHTPAPVLAAAEPRTRPAVHAEYVPDPVPVEPAAPDDEDELTALARAKWADLLRTGETPGIRTLRAAFHIGQDRAQRIRDELQRTPV